MNECQSGTIAWGGYCGMYKNGRLEGGGGRGPQGHWEIDNGSNGKKSGENKNTWLLNRL